MSLCIPYLITQTNSMEIVILPDKIWDCQSKKLKSLNIWITVLTCLVWLLILIHSITKIPSDTGKDIVHPLQCPNGSTCPTQKWWRHGFGQQCVNASLMILNYWYYRHKVEGNESRWVARWLLWYQHQGQWARCSWMEYKKASTLQDNVLTVYRIP